MNERAYKVSRLSAGNIGSLSALHMAVYGKTMSPGLFPKKYHTAYTGVEYIGFIATNEQDLPVAFYGVIPCFMLLNGDKILVAQSADTMTHPDFRGQGLFAQLAQSTCELCRANGIRFVFGFPNQNSLPGFTNKLGWQITDTMDRFTIAIKTIPLERLAAKRPFLTKLYKAYKHKVLKKYLSPKKGITSSVLPDGFNGMLRNDDFFNYKSYSETFTLKINGIDLWLKTGSGLMIGDISIVDEGTFAIIMDKLESIAGWLGIKQIHFNISPGTGLHRLFVLRYRPAVSFPVIFKDLDSGIDLHKIKFTFADLDIF